MFHNKQPDHPFSQIPGTSQIQTSTIPVQHAATAISGILQSARIALMSESTDMPSPIPPWIDPALLPVNEPGGNATSSPLCQNESSTFSFDVS